MVERKGDVHIPDFGQLVPVCTRCGRKLKSKRSIAIGMGPVCAARG